VAAPDLPIAPTLFHCQLASPEQHLTLLGASRLGDFIRKPSVDERSKNAEPELVSLVAIGRVRPAFDLALGPLSPVDERVKISPEKSKDERLDVETPGERSATFQVLPGE
jgi:hypothetical protein